MRATEGAVEDVEISEEGITLKVIGDQTPVGICGSGILAVLRELLKSGKMCIRDRSGTAHSTVRRTKA